MCSQEPRNKKTLLLVTLNQKDPLQDKVQSMSREKVASVEATVVAGAASEEIEAIEEIEEERGKEEHPSKLKVNSEQLNEQSII